MRNVLVPFFAVLLMIIGAVLLKDGFSNSGLNDTMKVLGGASCLSVGLISAWLALKTWWKWRQVLREQGHE